MGCGLLFVSPPLLGRASLFAPAFGISSSRHWFFLDIGFRTRGGGRAPRDGLDRGGFGGGALLSASS